MTIDKSQTKGTGRDSTNSERQINSLMLKELHPCDIKLSNDLIVDPTIDIPFANIPTGMESEETEIIPPPSASVIEDKDGTALVIP